MSAPRRDIRTGGPLYAGRLVFSIGCHSGYNVPNGETVVSRDPASAINASVTDPSLDMAEATLSQGGVLVGNTGFGYGDTDGISESEAVITKFAAHW